MSHNQEDMPAGQWSSGSGRTMKLPIYQINSFASGPFSGNPAAVCPLPNWIGDDLLQRIATETQLTTAFFVGEDGEYELRWFTPHTEISGICGHGTLAAAFVAATELNDDADSIGFGIKDGRLEVSRHRDGTYVLDLPALVPEPFADSDTIKAAFDGKATSVLAALDLFVIFPSADDVIDFAPDYHALISLPCRAAVITARGDDDSDFVSRWFCPKQGEEEDIGFTGSAHCSLVPYWAKQFGRNLLRARQPSPRGATIDCELRADRVLLYCTAVKYMEGQLYL